MSVSASLVPDGLRTNMLSLANFVDKHSVDVIGKPVAAKLQVLISINRELSAGLFTDVDSTVDEALSPSAAAPDHGLQNAGLRIST